MITGKRDSKCREDEELFTKLQLRLPVELEREGGATASEDHRRRQSVPTDDDDQQRDQTNCSSASSKVVFFKGTHHWRLHDDIGRRLSDVYGPHLLLLLFMCFSCNQTNVLDDNLLKIIRNPLK